MKTRIFIYYTGGTIGMAPSNPDDPDSPLIPKPIEELLKFVPGYSGMKLKHLHSDEAKKLFAEKKPFFELPNGNVIEFGHGTIKKPLDSSDISPVQWKEIALAIGSVYDDYDGFVILHGTDTMAFTSSALSFMFENLGKPVVITGSQLPISSARTDAVLNLINAVYIAGYKATDLPLIPEVVIAFADRIIRGCRASKVSTSDWAGFDSPNFPLLGTIGEHIVVRTGYLLPPPSDGRKFFVKTDMVDKVFNLAVFPGFSNQQMRKLFLDPEVEGIVMRSYGTGNVPNSDEFLETVAASIKGHSLNMPGSPEFLEAVAASIKSDSLNMPGSPEFLDTVVALLKSEGKAVPGGRLIVNLSQCTTGTVEMGLYEASSGLLERGVLSGLDMTPEAALTKLMWTLGTQYGEGRLSQMQISQRGEQTENLFDLRFGGLEQAKADDIFVNALSPDGRLDRNRISRSMLRISKVRVEESQPGEKVRIHVFMNMPRADHATSNNEERCVNTFYFEAAEQPAVLMKNITYKTQSVIGNGEVILTLVAEKLEGGSWVPAKIWFDGLYIAVYAKA